MRARARLGVALLAAVAGGFTFTGTASATDPTAAMYDPNRVIEVAIDLDPDAWNQLCAQKRTFVSLFRGACLAQPFGNPFTWFPARVTIDGQIRENAGVRKKGFLGSLDAIKPALKIDVAQFQSNAAVYGVKKLTLNNAKQDPSLIRQCLGYQLFVAAGAPAPRCNFAHVTVNGEDRGIYVNVEDIRKPLLARYFADDGGNLYEGTVSDFHPALVKTFESQTNEETNDRGDLDAVIAALGASDANLVASLGAIVDLPAFVRFWAMEALVGQWDGYSGNRNNFYAYHDPSSGKFHFLPWGTDTILKDGYPIASLDPASNTGLFAYSAITRRLVDIPALRAQYVTQMQTLLATVWDEATIEDEIDRMQALLTPYAGDLSSALAPVRAFVANRRAQLNLALANLPAQFSPLTILDFCLVQNGTVSGTFAATWGTAGSVPPFDTGAAVAGGSVSGIKLDTIGSGADAGFSAARPNPHEGFLNLYFQLQDGALAVMNVTLDSTRIAPGAKLAIDGQMVDGTMFVQGGAPGFLDHGTLKLQYGSTRPGGALCGSFEADTYTFSLAPITGAYPSVSPAAAFEIVAPKGRGTTSAKGGVSIGDVMRHCRPNGPPR